MSDAPGPAPGTQALDFSWLRRLPLVRQTESAECGLACLAMIAGYHGHRAGLAELRRRFPTSAQGTNLRQLADIATQLDFNARPLRADLDAMAQLQTPCILHWDMTHFVVLRAASRRKLEIHDPAAGHLKLSKEQVSRHYTGVALELTPTGTFEALPAGKRLRLRDLWSRIIGLRRILAMVLLLSLLLQLFSIAAPFYMQTVVDDVVLRGDAGLLATLATGFFLLLVIEVGARVLRASVILQLSTRLHYQLAANLFGHLVRLPIEFFQKRHLGDVISRFSSLDSIRDALGSGLVTAVVDGLMAMAMLAVMMLYDSGLSLIVIACVGLCIALRLLLFPALRQLSQQSIADHALSESILIESIRAIQAVKLHQREAQRQGLWQRRLAAAMNADIRVARLGIGLQASNTFLFGVENIMVVYFAAQAVIENAISLGMVFAFMSYKQRFSAAVDSLLERLIELKMLSLHLQRISDIALTKKEILRDEKPMPTPPSNSPPTALAGSDLGFRYSASDPWVFRNLGLDIKAGTTVAVVGSSGSGKSTLLKCLMGLLRFSEGELRVNGSALACPAAYRAGIGSVMQDDHLLSGSIADNIACFEDCLDIELIEQCARTACIHRDILAMPMQYETPVGDMGSTLSGGQVQRILLARALYRQPRILFLDEATSHVDTATEAQINRNIAGLSLTRVMVAHRPESVALADTVLELRQDCRTAGSRIVA